MCSCAPAAVSCTSQTNEFYLFRYNKHVPSFSIEHQLADNPEVTLNSTTSEKLQQQFNQLDNILEVSALHWGSLYECQSESL